jgi:hypothetical protein
MRAVIFGIAHRYSDSIFFLSSDLNHNTANLNPDKFAAVKRWLAGFGLVVLLFQTAYPAVFTAWFYSNRAIIASKYCVNRKRPKLNCDGKCYLAQKILAAESKQNNREVPAIANLWVENLPCIPENSIQLTKPFALLLQTMPGMANAHGADIWLEAPLRPPAS